jgi:hypothetical protein
MIAKSPVVLIDCSSPCWLDDLRGRLRQNGQVILLHFRSTPCDSAQLSSLAAEFGLDISYAWGSVVLKKATPAPLVRAGAFAAVPALVAKRPRHGADKL